MSDLVADYDELGAASDRLRSAAHQAEDVASNAGRLAGSIGDCGHAGLAGAAEHFLTRWSHGMGLLAEQSGALSELLALAADTYRRTDGDAASAAAALADRP